MDTATKAFRVWQIGPDGTEYFAAHSEEEMKEYYRTMLGPREKQLAEHDLKHHFEEVLDLDTEFDFEDDGEKTRSTWRKIVETGAKLPCQISTGYY